MGLLEGILIIISVLAVKNAYDNGAYNDPFAILWAILLGWNLHTLISML
jgi:hypothetical protein